MAKVKKDIHSLYFRTNGGVYRPIMCKWHHASSSIYLHDKGFNTDYMLKENGIQEIRKTYFNENDEVKVAAVNQTSSGSIRKDGIKEFWCCHGCYYDKTTNKPTVKSENLWIPALVTGIYDKTKFNKCKCSSYNHMGFITRNNKIAVECTYQGCGFRGPEVELGLLSESVALEAWNSIC